MKRNGMTVTGLAAYGGKVGVLYISLWDVIGPTVRHSGTKVKNDAPRIQYCMLGFGGQRDFSRYVKGVSPRRSIQWTSSRVSYLIVHLQCTQQLHEFLLSSDQGARQESSNDSCFFLQLTMNVAVHANRLGRQIPNNLPWEIL